MNQVELDAAVAVLPDAAMTLTPSGRVTAMNLAARREFESEGVPIGRLQDLAEDPARSAALLRAVLRTSAAMPGALRLETKRGLRSFRVDGARLPDGSGVLLQLRAPQQAYGAFEELNRKIATLGREVSRRRRAERRLESQVRVFEAIAGGQSLSVVLEAIARFVESESSEGSMASVLLLDGKVLRHGAAPSLPRAYTDAIDGVEIGPNVGSCGTAAHRGHEVIVADIATDPLWADFRDLALEHGLRACWSLPVLDSEGTVLATVAHYSRTPRAPSEDDLQLLVIAGYLAGMAIERDRRESALHQRATELAEANARTNEFLAMLGHELRNPLSPMATTLALLREEGHDAERRQFYCGTLDRQLGLIRRLVDDLLDIARVTRGKIELRPVRLDLREIVQTVHDERPHDSRLRLSLPAEPVWVDADPDRMQQVIGNLVHNAAKFTPEDGRITLALDLEPEGQVAALRVEDTGTGIDASDLRNIFDLFAQARPTIDRSSGGLGIGLTLVRSLVEHHGGGVTATSEGLDRGSQFEVRLPLRPAPEVPAPGASDARGEDESPAAGPTSEGIDILVVDDNQDSAELLAGLLSRWGNTTRIAFDGPDALEEIKQRLPRLVILDIGLPGVDGYEVARRIRANQSVPPSSCTLVAMTGYGQASDQQRASDAGFDHFMVKPVDLPALRSIIEQVQRARADSIQP